MNLSGRPGSRNPAVASSSAASAASASSRPASRAAGRRSLCSSTASARARRAPFSGSRRSRRRIERPTVRAPILSTWRAASPVGATPPSPSASTSSCIKNGVPRVARTHASTKTGSGACTEPRLHELGNACSRERREADHYSRRIGRHRRQQLGIGADLPRAGCQDECDVQLFETRE